MSEAVGGCHAGADEKIGRLDERSQFIVERNNSCKWIGVIALLVALAGLFVAWTALRDLDAVKRDIEAITAKQEQISGSLLDAERAYQNARNTLSRAKRRK